jgi:protein-disulfide isomerase
MPLLSMLPARTHIGTVAATPALAGVRSAQTITTQQADEIQKELRASTTYTEYDTTISKDMTEGAGFSVNGTPTFFVGKPPLRASKAFASSGHSRSLCSNNASKDC